jgi:hypothetical protein
MERQAQVLMPLVIMLLIIIQELFLVRQVLLQQMQVDGTIFEIAADNLFGYWQWLGAWFMNYMRLGFRLEEFLITPAF